MLITLHIGPLYRMKTSALRQVLDYVEVTEGGYIDLPLKRPTALTKSEIAERIEQLDSRLIWRGER